MRERDQYLRTAGARIRYRVAGRGPAVVLVHGWALDLDMWAPQFALLSARLHVIAFDRRGFGLSAGEPDAERDVDDLHALLDALSIERAAIVGMSQGARLALAFAASLPERVSCLVLDGPPRLDAQGVDASSADVPIARYREMTMRNELDAVREEWVKHPLMQLHRSDPGARALLREMVARYPGHDLRAADPGAPSFAPTLRSLSVPALVVNGAHDSSERRSAGVALARALSGARHVLVPGAAHIPNLDAPGAYCDLIADFVYMHAHAPEPGARADRHAERRT